MAYFLWFYSSHWCSTLLLFAPFLLSLSPTQLLSKTNKALLRINGLSYLLNNTKKVEKQKEENWIQKRKSWKRRQRKKDGVNVIGPKYCVCVCEPGSKDLEREDVCVQPTLKLFFFLFVQGRGRGGGVDGECSVNFLNSKIGPPRNCQTRCYRWTPCALLSNAYLIFFHLPTLIHFELASTRLWGSTSNNSI